MKYPVGSVGDKPKYDKRNLLRGAAAAALIGSAVLGYGLLRSSDNVSRHLKSPESLCMGLEDYAALQFVKEYRNDISEASRKYKVPAELVAATILEENQGREKFQDWKDWSATGYRALVYDATLGRVFSKAEPSLGPGQVRTSTARKLDAGFNEKPKSREEIETLLQNPTQNIHYTAKALSDLMYRGNRLNGANILDDPHRLEILGTEYVKGATKSTLSEAVPSMEGRNFLLSLVQWDFQKLFGEPFTMTREQRQKILEYWGSKKSIEMLDSQNSALERLCF